MWATLRTHTEEADLAALRGAKQWQALKADAGFTGIQWPVADGGRGLSPQLAALFKAEEARFDVPANAFQVGVDMVGPTLIAHASEELRDRHLHAIRRGDEVWCQLFSEPGAGSDLAGLSTRAKHRGITYLLVDMTSPGIEVRPLRQIDGAIHFNEVFFNDVVIPVSNVVGEINGGWGVTMTTLVAERSAIGGGGMVQFAEILLLAREMGRTADPTTRQRLAELHTMFEITRFLNYRVQTSLTSGEEPGPESSVMKLHISRQYEAGGDIIEELLGAAGTLVAQDAPFGGFFQGVFLSQWAPRIGGGTDQVQRNVVGERVLGLPGEPRPDKHVPFRETLRA